MSEQQRRALGIDLGGTSIKVGVVSESGTISGQVEIPTEVPSGVSGVVANMARAAWMAMTAAGVTPNDLDGVGIGSPGICDGASGTVVYGVNLNFKNVPVAPLLSDVLQMDVRLENDANCAALGEQWCGAARGCDHLLMVTLGTGVGGALILNGRVYAGAKGWAGEFGHMPAVANGWPCNCGRRGCVETVTSASAIARVARQEIEAGRAPDLAQRAQDRQGEVDARLVIEAAREGDAVALQIMRGVADALGTALGGLTTALNPELIVVGGGVSRAGDLLLAPLRAMVVANALPGPAEAVRVVLAELGNDAGLIGAASLVWR